MTRSKSFFAICTLVMGVIVTAAAPALANSHTPEASGETHHSVLMPSDYQGATVPQDTHNS